MDSDSPTALHKRLVELLRASGHRPLRVSQVAAILGVDDDDQHAVLRDVLARSRIVDYDAAQQIVRSLLPEDADRDREGENKAALLALSDVDALGSRGEAATHVRPHQRRSNSRHAPHSRGGGGGYLSDTGLPRRRTPGGGWNKPGQRTMDEASNYLGPVGRVGYVCVADELHLGKLETYYRAQGYYTKFDFDVLHVRFAQPASAASVKVENEAAAGGRERDKVARRSTGQRGSESSLPATHTPDSSSPRDDSPHHFHNQSDDTAAPSSNMVRTAADTSPSHRNYGTTRSLRGTAMASGEGGEAPAAAATSAAAASSANASAGAKQGFDLFIFPYGAVVWWGFDQRYFKIVENDYMLPHSAIGHCMTNRYTTQLVNENYPVWCTYNLVRRDTLEVDDDFKARLRFDHFVIPYSRGEVATGSVLMLCASHALAQSAKIDYIELQVQELADSCSPLPRELREKGTVSITERRLLQLRGEVLSYRLMLKSGSDLLDEPDLFWENAYLKPVFQATKEEYEIAERVEALDNKLDAANEILSMLAEDFSQRHGARLEWIVIWLVFVEVVIGVLELLVDIRPWIRAKA